MRDAATWVGDLARRALVGASRSRPPRVGRAEGERLRVILTIDTEISLGGALRDRALMPVGPKRRIWGETERGAFGITRFMDIFDELGLKAVFFFEPVARHVVGERDLAEAAACISSRGHDVELHVHPEFEMDLDRVRSGQAKSPSPVLFEHSLEEQRRHVRESAAKIEEWCGRRPSAFRAGGYSANELTMKALVEEGIFIDSSYNRWAIDLGLCGFHTTPPLNDARMLREGVLEVPVTNLATRGPRGGIRPFELSALNVSEMISALDQMYEAGMRVACAVTHSFRLLRARDVQYRDVAPDVFNLHRLQGVCRHLADHRDRFEVCSFRDLPVEEWKRDPLLPDAAPYYPTPPTWSSVARLAVQAIKDRGAV